MSESETSPPSPPGSAIPLAHAIMSLDEARSDSVSGEALRADIIRSAAFGQGPTFIAAKLD